MTDSMRKTIKGNVHNQGKEIIKSTFLYHRKHDASSKRVFVSILHAWLLKLQLITPRVYISLRLPARTGKSGVWLILQQFTLDFPPGDQLDMLFLDHSLAFVTCKKIEISLAPG